MIHSKFQGKIAVTKHDQKGCYFFYCYHIALALCWIEFSFFFLGSLSCDRSFAQQIRVAFKRLLAHESLSKPFNSSQTSEASVRQKRVIWPKYNLFHTKDNLQESFYKNAWERVRECVCAGGCVCGVVCVQMRGLIPIYRCWVLGEET